MILLEQLRTLDRKRLRDYIGCLDKETMSKLFSISIQLFILLL